MAKGDRVQSLPAVKALNEQLRQSKKLMTGLTGASGDLGAAVMLIAEKNEKNLKYSKENQNIAKTESKLAKGMVGVLKARERVTPKTNTIKPVVEKTDQSGFLSIKSIMLGTAIVQPIEDISIPRM